MKTLSTRFRLGASARDRFKIPGTLWDRLKAMGISAGTVLRRSNLPLTVCSDKKTQVSTAQFFAIWKSIGEISDDATLGWKLASRIETERYHPSMLAALHARNCRDGIERMARYKQLCCAEEMQITKEDGDYAIRAAWPFAEETVPALLIDAAFAAVIELGRRGTKTNLIPKRIELKRPPGRRDGFKDYFQCPVKYRARRDALILRASDLDLPFITHNNEMLQMLTPQLERNLKNAKAQRGMLDQVKWVLKRLLPDAGPDILIIAKELGVSSRTLQRRITEEGTSFRHLLHETRKELVREYLSNPAMEINEAAFLLGYEDPNSFYRAFKTWEKTTPARWRIGQRGAAE